MIDILLSTYNGEKFLEKQITSILNQSFVNWTLYIRDDGSSDHTLAIIDNYIKEYPEKIIKICDGGKNIGTLHSFEVLLTQSNSPYIMFCDQDDIWLPDKIEITLNKMKDLEKIHSNTPILIHTDLKVVDYNLNIMCESFWNLTHIKPTILSNFNYLGVCNAVTGCTMMINSKTKDICLPFSAYASMHDFWIALCVAKYGKINFIKEKTILYRQHQSNQIGAIPNQDLLSYIKNKILNLKNTIRKNKKNRMMLKDLSYGNLFKYVLFKILYFLKSRI